MIGPEPTPTLHEMPESKVWELRIGLFALATLDTHKLGANGVTFVSHANSGWTCNAVGRELTCDYLNKLSSWHNNVRIRTNLAGERITSSSKHIHRSRSSRRPRGTTIPSPNPTATIPSASEASCSRLSVTNNFPDACLQSRWPKRNCRD